MKEKRKNLIQSESIHRAIRWLSVSFLLFAQISTLAPSFANDCGELLESLVDDDGPGILPVLEDNFSPMLRDDLKWGMADIEEAIAADPKLKKIQKAFNDPKNLRIELSTYSSGDRRRLILGTGFIKNGHETGNSVSGGGGNKRMREVVEAAYAGMSLTDYRKIKKALRPKYAAINLDPKFNIPPFSSSAYGDDKWILKAENLVDRMTWTPGDSLNRFNQSGVEPRWQYGKSYKGVHWDQAFIPWKYRNLSIPFLANGIEAKKIFSVTDLPAPLIMPGGKAYKLPVSKGWSSHRPLDRKSNSISYLEAQIWGRISLDDVKEFHFRNALSCPTGKETQILLDHKIKIFYAPGDAPAVKWDFFHPLYPGKKLVLLPGNIDPRKYKPRKLD